MVLLYVYAATAAVLAGWHWRDLYLLCFPGMEAKYVLEYPFREPDLRRARARAWRRLYGAAGIFLLVVAYAHVYEAERGRLEAEREGVLSQPPPYGCAGNTDWDSLPVTEKLTGGHDPERCERYLLALRRSTWPNPLGVLIDTLFVVPARALDAASDAFGRALGRVVGYLAWYHVVMPFAAFASLVALQRLRAMLPASAATTPRAAAVAAAAYVPHFEPLSDGEPLYLLSEDYNSNKLMA